MPRRSDDLIRHSLSGNTFTLTVKYILLCFHFATSGRLIAFCARTLDVSVSLFCLFLSAAPDFGEPGFLQFEIWHTVFKGQIIYSTYDKHS